jgi:NADH dehydrogenase
MPTFGRKLRIAVEWSWGMLCPTDITPLRYTRSHELVDAERAAPPIGAATIGAD